MGHLPGILDEGPAILRSGIQHLFGSLDVSSTTSVAGRAQQEVRHVRSSHRTVKGELSVRTGKVPFVHLEITEFPSSLPRMLALRFGKNVTHRIGSVGLERV